MKKLMATLLTVIMIIPMCCFVGCEDFKNQGKGYEAIIVYNYGTLCFSNGVKTLNIRLQHTSEYYPFYEGSFNLVRVRKYNRFDNHDDYSRHPNEDAWIYPVSYGENTQGITVDSYCGGSYAESDGNAFIIDHIGHYELHWVLRDGIYEVDEFTLYVEIY